jgi:hypothetical protein
MKINYEQKRAAHPARQSLSLFLIEPRKVKEVRYLKQFLIIA